MAAALDVAALASTPAEVDDDDAALWERSFAFGSLPRLVIQEHFGAGLGGTVWAGGVKLARHLVDDGGAGRLVSDLRRDRDSGQPERLHALELGAGCSGIPGLVLAQLGLFHSIFITDGDEDAVERLEENLADNVAALQQQPGESSTLVKAGMLRWGHDTDMAAAAAAVAADGGLYDVVVAADVAYHMRHTDPGADAVVAALCGTIRRLMRPAGVCVLSQMVRQLLHALAVSTRLTPSAFWQARPLHEECVLYAALLAEYHISRLDEPEPDDVAGKDGGMDIPVPHGLGVFLLRRRDTGVSTDA